MKIFGLTITREKKSLTQVPSYSSGGYWQSIIREPFTGAWQRNIKLDTNTVLSFHAVFACVTLIASDIAKLRVRLVQQDANGIWSEFASPAYSPVLRRPNQYQNRIQFWENWILSKLTRGNAYILKERDNRNVVIGLYVLDPNLVTPLVADDGSVFYRLYDDKLSSISNGTIVPAREIIHDRMNCLFHPLCGISPIYANALGATQGLNIQRNSVMLFQNNASPGGILTAPGQISEPTAKRIKEDWENNYGGQNIGRVAVLGDGLKFEKMALTAVEGQLIEQLKWTAEVVCSTFHVPPYKIGIGPMPTYNNIQALNVEYYSQCLQSLIEAAELCLDEGLEMPPGIGTEFDLDNLLRMDSVTQVTVEKEAVGAGIKSPNESRRRFDLRPVDGGDAPYLQQQNYSLAALAKRDAQDDPFASKTPAKAPAATGSESMSTEEDVGAAKMIAVWKLKELMAA